MKSIMKDIVRMFKLHFVQAMYNFQLKPISRLFMTQITLVDDTVYSYDL